MPSPSSFQARRRATEDLLSGFTHINEELDELAEDEEGGEQSRLKSRWAALEKLVGAEPRIKSVAKDLVEHFEERNQAQNGKAMHSGGSQARASVERAAGVDQALSDTGDSVQRINDMAAQIATACEEQGSVTEEIARNISDIRDLSNDAAQNSEQSTRASQHLSELSGSLAQLVGRFRV